MSSLVHGQLSRRMTLENEIQTTRNYFARTSLPELMNLSSSTLRRLIGKLERLVYLPGQFVYKSGEPAREVYIVGSGVLQNIREIDGHVNLVLDGEIFGEENFLSMHQTLKRSSNVTACGYTELYMLRAADVIEVLNLEVSDSALPPSPGRKQEEELKLPKNIGLIVRPDIANKLNLIETDKQRDRRVNDVIRDKDDVTENDVTTDPSTSSAESLATSEKKQNNLFTRTVTYSGKNRKRTVLPVSATNSTKSNSKYRRPSAIQETPLDVYGSLVSLNTLK